METVSRPDERAAGVISGSDPYKELELYLEKVNEEIGEVFERWKEEAAAESAWSEDILTEFNTLIAEVLFSVGDPRGTSPDDGEDSGLERSAELLDKRDDDPCQISPAVSRSSSYTWSEDSSSQDSSSSSPQPDSSGASTPPRERAKCRRKETWEKLRCRPGAIRREARCPEVWVRRRDSSSEPHLRPPRPDMGGKSSSTPLLAPSSHLSRVGCCKQLRSRSEKQLTEIEASEALEWLRAAGFPQYAQMYEDLQFPIDVSSVEKDHPFLDPDSLQSLFRRLQALNKCAAMKIDAPAKQPQEAEESDEEEQCALSENWTFQPEIRRWSRVSEVNSQKLAALQAAAGGIRKGMSGEKGDTPVIRYGSLPPGALSPDSELLAAKFRRSGSERLRDGAKAFLRRMESLKSRKRKRQREGVVISSPQVVDIAGMEKRMRDLNCVDVSPPDSPIPSVRCRRLLPRPEPDVGALSDSELPWRQTYYKDANSNHAKVLDFTEIERRGGSCRERLSPSSRSVSLTNTPDSNTFRTRPLRKPPEIQVFKENEIESAESSSAIADSDSDTTPRQKGVVRWHSFQRGSVRPESYLGQPVSSMSSGQLLVLRKLALLKLTSIMERHCPSHRTGWNWELPKFMRKMKNPDYKDKTVFGVPLVVSLQKCGQPLPQCILSALNWLRNNALDQVGLFRKSGVKSRIERLKSLCESGDELIFEGQQVFDVADMVKLYFRDIPGKLLTDKLSETFIAIFQHVPVNLRVEAVQCALLLLPDEHREALHSLLVFLNEVATHSPTNQMSASNLALCLAPSLFPDYVAPARPASPRRGAPDPRQLAHNKAAHDCLLALIKNHKELFTVCDELLAQCHFSYMEQSVPVALEELGSELGQDWRGYMYACTTALLKEAREKTRGWVSVGSGQEGVEMWFKKVGDGHPLRLWRVTTEVEAPPTELLHRILRERETWDTSLIKWRVVARLDSNAEVFQFLTASVPPTPPKDYCVLRCWRTELAKGACVIVETSVEHPEGQVLSGGVRGIVLASRYLIEPCGSGRSRVVHLSRVDTKGRTPDWYNKSYGHVCALYLSRIRNSFKHTAGGPESKV